jgi:putative tricarboxylic transport membrane protein
MLTGGTVVVYTQFVRSFVSRTANWRLRLAIAVLPVVLAAVAGSHGAQAAGWKPTRNVEIIVPFAAGGGNDIPTRIIQKIITDQKLIDVSSTVVNKPGGGGAVGLAYLNRHAGSGEYLSIISTSTLTSYVVGEGTLNYTDVTPIVPIITEYIAFVVNENSPIKSFAEFISRMKANPKSMSFGVGGAVGNPNHVAIAAALAAAGVDPKQMKAVAFNSGGEAMTAVLGGHVDLVAGPADLYVPLVQAKRLRLLAVAAPERLEGALSSVPTLVEQNIKLVSAYTRYIVGPKGMPVEAVNEWSAVLSKVMQASDWKKAVTANYWQSKFETPAETQHDIADEFQQIRATLAKIDMAKR